MDQFLGFLHDILPVLHVLAAIAFILKMIIVFRSRGFNLPAVLVSFFRIYSRSDKYMTNNKARQQYIVMNNYINYFLYTWAFIALIVFIVYQSPFSS